MWGEKGRGGLSYDFSTVEKKLNLDYVLSKKLKNMMPDHVVELVSWNALLWCLQILNRYMARDEKVESWQKGSKPKAMKVVKTTVRTKSGRLVSRSRSMDCGQRKERQSNGIISISSL